MCNIKRRNILETNPTYGFQETNRKWDEYSKAPIPEINGLVGSPRTRVKYEEKGCPTK